MEIIRLTGEKISNKDEKNKARKSAIEAEGPHVPGVGKEEYVSGQDEVDDLLSSLGF